jgi:multiple sugar transport system substrate-binding protein
VDLLDEAALVEELEIPPDGHVRDAELAGEIDDPDGALGPDAIEDEREPLATEQPFASIPARRVPRRMGGRSDRPDPPAGRIAGATSKAWHARGRKSTRSNISERRKCRIRLDIRTPACRQSGRWSQADHASRGRAPSDPEEEHMAMREAPQPEQTDETGFLGKVHRRDVLKGIGAASLLSVPAIVAACSTGSTPEPSAGASTEPSAAPSVGGEVTFGSNYSDEVPKAAMQAVVDAFTAATGIAVKVNTVDHGTFQDQISNYLQGTPDDTFTWFAGYRMRFFASQGLATDISDVWAKVGGNYSDAFKSASTGDDGKQYFIPFYNYPWVVIYRKSLWEEKGYTEPKTLDELKALGDKMKADGIVPISFADKDGWPAMGTFDILNMRQNGYDFHIGLMAGTEKWTDAKVKTVFEVWKGLIPYQDTEALGRTWQEAAQKMIAKEAGMYFLGTFAGEQASEADRADLSFFAFPTLGTEFDAEMGIDAPIDGFMVSKAPKNLDGAKAFMEYLSTGEAQIEFLKASPNSVAAGNDADTSGYSEFQKMSAAIIASSGKIAQFLDRDTRPDFAGPNGMQGFLQNFLNDPEQDLDAFLQTIQDFWDSL